MASTSPVIPSRLFDSYWLVEFDEDEPDPSAKPKVKYTFPDTIEDMTMVRSVPSFCFPEEAVTLTWEQKRKEVVTEEFSFVLTASDGTKRFGFCRRVLLKPEPGWKPLCICLISKWSTFALFRAILNAAELVRPQGVIALDSLLDEVTNMPMPDKGKSLKLNVYIPLDEKQKDTTTPIAERRKRAQERRLSSRIFKVVKTNEDGVIESSFQSDIEDEKSKKDGPKKFSGSPKGFLDFASEELKTFTITRPDADYEFLDYVTFEPLFSRFSVKDILIMFTALLKERRVLVIAQTVPNLSSIINALSALISPFSWQLLDFVEAPMPYVIGVLRQSKTKVLNRHIEMGTLIINADKGEFFSPPIDSPDEFLPPGPGGTLKRALERVQQSDCHDQSFNTIVAHSFLRFWVDIFKDYQKYFRATGEFESDRFIKSRASNLRQTTLLFQRCHQVDRFPSIKFMTDIINSQMVEVYMHEREDLFRMQKIETDVLVYSSAADLRAKIDAEYNNGKGGKSEVPTSRSTLRASLIKRKDPNEDDGLVKEEESKKADPPKERETKKVETLPKERPKARPKAKIGKSSAQKYSTMPVNLSKSDPDGLQKERLGTTTDLNVDPKAAKRLGIKSVESKAQKAEPKPERKSEPKVEPMAENFYSLEQIVADKDLLSEFTFHVQKDEAVDMAFTFYLELRKLGFKFDEVPFSFLQKVSFAAAVAHSNGIPNSVVILPLDEHLTSQISKCLDTQILTKEVVDELYGHILKLINRKILTFTPSKGPPTSTIPDSKPSVLLGDLNAAFSSPSNPDLLANLTTPHGTTKNVDSVASSTSSLSASISPASSTSSLSSAKSTPNLPSLMEGSNQPTESAEEPEKSPQIKDKESPNKDTPPLEPKAAKKEKDKVNFFGKMKELTRKKTGPTSENQAKSKEALALVKEKEKEKDKQKRSTFDPEVSEFVLVDIPKLPDTGNLKNTKPSKSPRSSIALESRQKQQIASSSSKSPRSPAKTFQPIASRFDWDGSQGAQAKNMSKSNGAPNSHPSKDALARLSISVTKRVIGFGKDFDGQVLAKFPLSQTVLKSGDLLTEVAVYLPILKLRYPPIDVYKSQFGDYYAIPLGTGALNVLLDFVYSDKISIAALTDPEDIIDLIRFCGGYIPKLRSELLSHFIEQVKVSNCIKYLTIAYGLARDPASSREINRALNYLKYFFVSNWDRVTMEIDMDIIPNDLLIELIRLNSRTNLKMLTDLKRSIEILSTTDSDDDTLSRTLLALLSAPDSTFDFTFAVHEQTFKAHKYIISANAPGNQLGVFDSSVILPDTLMPSAVVFEVLLHYLYTQDFLADALPPADLNLAHNVWQSGMFYLGADPSFENKLASYYSSFLNVRGIVDLLFIIEEKPYAIPLKDAIIQYAAKNISVLAKSPLLQKLPRPTLVSLIEKLA